MTDEELREDEPQPAAATSTVWVIEHIIGTRVGPGGTREKAKTGIDRIRYRGKPVGNCGRKPGTFCHITHPVAETSEAEYEELKGLLAQRDADRYNRLYAKGGETKTPANFMDRGFVIQGDTLDPDMMD